MLSANSHACPPLAGISTRGILGKRKRPPIIRGWSARLCPGGGQLRLGLRGRVVGNNLYRQLDCRDAAMW